MSNEDFWNTLMGNALFGNDLGDVDSYLSGREFDGDFFKSVRQVVDSQRNPGLSLPVEAGTRVAFVGSIGSVLSYADPPAPGTVGTVVSVKTAGGDTTEHNGSVFVDWGHGVVQAIHASHLEPAVGVRKSGRAQNRIRVASLGDLTDFLKVSSDTLIHKSTRDLWSVQNMGEGYVIERLFDDVGKPLKGDGFDSGGMGKRGSSHTGSELVLSREYKEAQREAEKAVEAYREAGMVEARAHNAPAFTEEVSAAVTVAMKARKKAYSEAVAALKEVVKAAEAMYSAEVAESDRLKAEIPELVRKRNAAPPPTGPRRHRKLSPEAAEYEERIKEINQTVIDRWRIIGQASTLMHDAEQAKERFERSVWG